ncbi:hypothetical protein H310_04433 [Aphanomyces invadans]|uniref:Thioredoxin domain-containing protein n=1 Tax=Aphanomyces invadans TaxID=157072 RepID=A0A024UCW4_9STRA|nr:hypothetical protein H310_04433 [Aphanomyces invadans]ETW04050.1 hypothetical protein H310_04433 [Aphanomyces invadans]|eukprot:XP_008867006.1 hypothetical protein H310_04433 [Aphanomyces invadans]
MRRSHRGFAGWVLAVLLAMIMLRGSSAHEPSTSTWTHEHVHELSTIAQTRASEMETSKKLWIVLYGNRDDPILSVLNQVGGELSYAVSFAWISADVAQSFGLQAAKPPILITFRDEPKWNPYQERMYRTLELVHQFPSQLDARALKKIVRDKAPSAVQTSWPDKDDDAAWLPTAGAATPFASTSNSPPRVVLVTKKSTPSLLYKSLSIEFPSLKFFSLPDSPEVLEQFHVSSVPSLLVGLSLSQLTSFKESDGDVTNFDDLCQFLRPHVPTTTTDVQSTSSSLWFTRDDLDVAIRNSSHAAWLVVVQSKTSPNIVDPSNDDWKQTVIDLRSKVGLDLIRVAMVNDASPTAAGIYSVRYGPSTAMVKAPLTSSVETVVKHLIESLPDSTSALYGPSDIQAFFGRMLSKSDTVSFVLFTSKKDTPLLVQAIALTFPTHVQVGVVFNPDQDTKKQFGLGKLPAMVAVMSPRDPSVPREQFSMTFYDKQLLGPPTFENVHRFVDHVVQAYVPKQGDPNEHSADTATTATVHSVTTQSEFTNACTSLCVIGLTHGADDIATQTVLKDVAVQSAAKKHPLQYVAVDAVCQPEFASVLGAESWQIPAIVMYSPGKRRYVRHVGGLDADATLAFVQSVLAGKTGTAPLSTAPTLATECAAVVNDVTDAPVIDDDDDGEMEAMMREIREEEQRQAEMRKRQLKEEMEARKAAEDKAKADEAAKVTEKKPAKKSTKKKKKTVKPRPKDEL